jgi:hypothetical protein
MRAWGKIYFQVSQTTKSKAEQTGSLTFTHATATIALNIPICSDLNGVAPFLDVGY